MRRQRRERRVDGDHHAMVPGSRVEQGDKRLLVRLACAVKRAQRSRPDGNDVGTCGTGIRCKPLRQRRIGTVVHKQCRLQPALSRHGKFVGLL